MRAWPLAGAHFKLEIGDLALSDCGNMIRCPVLTCGLVFRLANEIARMDLVTLDGRVVCPSGSHSYTVDQGFARMEP